MNYLEQVIAVDPGGTTGLVRARGLHKPLEALEAVQEPWERAIDLINAGRTEEVLAVIERLESGAYI